MSTTQVRSPIFFVAVALLGLVAVAAPTAPADAVDSNFLGAIGSKGINLRVRAKRDRRRS